MKALSILLPEMACTRTVMQATEIHLIVRPPGAYLHKPLELDTIFNPPKTFYFPIL